MQTRLAKIQTEEALASKKLQNSFMEFEIDEQEDEAKTSVFQDAVKPKKESKTLKQATAPERDMETIPNADAMIVRQSESQLLPCDKAPFSM